LLLLLKLLLGVVPLFRGGVRRLLSSSPFLPFPVPAIISPQQQPLFVIAAVDDSGFFTTLRSMGFSSESAAGSSGSIGVDFFFEVFAAVSFDDFLLLLLDFFEECCFCCFSDMECLRFGVSNPPVGDEVEESPPPSPVPMIGGEIFGTKFSFRFMKRATQP
jgi:hypothetical protein